MAVFCTEWRAPHVPLSQKNNELYPIPYMKRNILHDILGDYINLTCELQEKNVEVASFTNGLVITNHTSTPISVESIKGKRDFQYPVNEICLIPRSSVCIITN